MAGRLRARQVFYRVLIAGLCVTALVAVIGLASGDFDDTDGRILGSTFLAVLFCLTSLAGFSLLTRAHVVALGYVAIGASVLGFITWMNLIWSEGFDDPAMWKPAYVSLVVALAAANASLLLIRRRETDPPSVRAVLAATLGLVTALAAMLVIAGLGEIEDGTYYRWLGVVAVLWALGTLLLPILRIADPSSKKPGQPSTRHQRSSSA